MENTQRNRNAKKLKSVSATAIAVDKSSRKTSSSFAYKNFNSAGNKRRKNRKKYFEHDTRTHTKRPFAAAAKAHTTGGGGGGGGGGGSGSGCGATAPIKKIKFNNEINIYETRNDITTELDVSKCKAATKKGQKKRGRGGFHHRRNAGGGSGGGGGGGGGVTSIQSTTKRLQKQLIETQKKLQKQLNAMQQQQREQNHSFLALIHSNYIHAHAKNDGETGAAGSDATDTDCNPLANCLSKSTAIDDSHVNAIKNASCPNATHTSAHCPEQFVCQSDFCTDQSKCSIDKMANGNKATTIRAFNCDLKKVNSKSFTPPLATTTTTPTPSSSSVDGGNIECSHRCSTCIGYRKLASTVHVDAAALSSPIKPAIDVNHKKLFRIQLKKPLLKSIVLSAAKNSGVPAISSGTCTIKQESTDDLDEQSVPPFASTCGTPPTTFMHSESESIKPHSIEIMQFSNSKKTNKQINSIHSNNANDFVRQQKNSRSYSPPLPAAHRLASMVSSDSTHHSAAVNDKRSRSNNNNNGHGHCRRSNSSRHRRNRSSEKRKKHRRTHSRGSRSHSRSRSYSRSRSRSRSDSHTHSTSRSRSVSGSRSHSRSRSYRRHSSRSHSRSRTRSRTHSRSSRSYSRSHYSEDRKSRRSSKSQTKRGSDDRKGSSGGGGGGSGASKRHSNSKNKSKSPSNDSAFSSSKQSNHSPSDSKRMKRSTTSLANDANGSTAKKKSTLSISSVGAQVKPQPVVKLHSSPTTGSDTENEIDDKFDRKYEELLTFETNEDERREQRLLKALSDIAAKAKQKIQSITDPNATAVKTPNADRNHNDRSTPKTITNTDTPTNIPPKHNTHKPSEALHDGERQRSAHRPISTDRYSSEHSPPSRLLQHHQPPPSLPPPSLLSSRDRKPSKRDSATKRSRRDSSCSSSSSKEDKTTRSSRSPSIPRRRGSPSFLDRRRITSARKKPIPYQRSSPYDSYDEWDSS